jgi:type 1 glutamine amidotransferase
MLRRSFCLLVAAGAVACLAGTALAADGPRVKKIVLLGMDRDHGPGEHEYMAGLALLAESLRHTKGAEPVVLKDWPADDKVLDDAAAIVCYLGVGGDFLLKKPEHRAKVMGLMKKGVGFVALHWAVEASKDLGDPYMAILGGYYEPGYSKNPTNKTTVRPADPQHPISRGWQPFEARDEFYYNIRLLPEAKAVVVAELGGKDETIGWVYERKDSQGPLGPGRSFGFTGCHYLVNFTIPEFRRLLVNGILWTADVPVPEKGAEL